MYGNRNWYKDPLVWIPLAILWCALDMIAMRFDFAGKMSRKNPKKKRDIQKILHIVCFVLSWIIVMSIDLIIYAVTGVNIMDLD